MLGEAEARCRWARYDRRFVTWSVWILGESIVNLETYGAGVLLYRGDHVLLSKRDGDAPTWAHYWNFFGGHSDAADGGDPFVTAMREVREEIQGVDFTSLVPELLACIRVNFQGEVFMSHYFKAEVNQPLSDLKLGDEGNGLAEFTVEEIDRLAVTSQHRLVLDIHFGRFPAELLATCPVHTAVC
jgi:hypothetical protein